MNTLQRLLSNSLLAFLSSALVKVSNSILFIMIGRSIGPEEAGVFTLGIAFYTSALALSTWGLHELLVREVAPRRDQSARYLLNYVVMRLLLSAVFYGGMFLLLRTVLPYPVETQQVILIMGLAIFFEAIYSLAQALFTAHEEQGVPTLAALVNSVVTLGAGYWLLQTGVSAEATAWAIPMGVAAGLVVFLPALVVLFRRMPQVAPARIDLAFCREQLRYAPGFILLGIFGMLNFQADTLLISLVMTGADLGFYGAAQTVLSGFMLMPIGIRTALYPLMARYHKENPVKLAKLYEMSFSYLLVGVMPIAMGVMILAQSVIRLLFGDGFDPAVPVLEWTIWSVVFLFLSVPPARLMLVHDKQQLAGWMRGGGMVASVALNLLLIPLLGIVGAGIARLITTAVFFALLFGYVQLRIQPIHVMGLVAKTILATVVMGAAVWPLRDLFLPIPIVAGMGVYGVAVLLLGVVSAEDRQYIRMLMQTRNQ